MRFVSVCSGIEAASVAWEPLGFRAQWLSEIDAFPSAVLAHHYPTVPNLGDMTRFKEWPDATFDVLVGGTPCQSFSIAGLRAGMDDPRGNLLLVYLAIADRYRPRWLVWENVPGVLSSNDGRDFAALLGGMAKLGYGFAYRILDAQYFGLAQRRRRVFVVGYLGDWRRAAAVLFERESLRGDTPPRRETRERVAPTLSARTQGGGGLGTDFELDGGLIPQIARPLLASGTHIDEETETLVVAHALRADGFDASEDGTGRGTPLVVDMQQITSKTNQSRVGGPVASTMTSMSRLHAIEPHDVQAVALRGREAGATAELSGDVSTALRASQGGSDKAHAMIGTAVRRLTPRECERLQGFPDDYTAITYRGKPAADGPRYKSLGNSMAVPVMRWLGRRIALVDQVIGDPLDLTVFRRKD